MKPLISLMMFPVVPASSISAILKKFIALNQPKSFLPAPFIRGFAQPLTTVTLTGVIKLKTFPGAPNYESVEAGDDMETYPYLFLDHPIDAVVPKNDTNPEDQLENNLKIIQIAAGNDDNWDDKYMGKQVRVTGKLYHRLTGHHHTRVLIYAIHFELVQ